MLKHKLSICKSSVQTGKTFYDLYLNQIIFFKMIKIAQFQSFKPMIIIHYEDDKLSFSLKSQR